jgi:hypothetical protein
MIWASIRRMLEIGEFVTRIARAGDAGPGSLERRRRESPYFPMVSPRSKTCLTAALRLPDACPTVLSAFFKENRPVFNILRLKADFRVL